MSFSNPLLNFFVAHSIKIVKIKDPQTRNIFILQILSNEDHSIEIVNEDPQILRLHPTVQYEVYAYQYS